MASNNKYDIDTSGVSDLFKDTYGTPSEATFNSKYPIVSQLMKKTVDFVGNQHKFPVQTTFSGSNSFGSLPDTNVSNDETVLVTDKSCYGRLRVDRRTMKKAVKDKGAFVQGTRTFVQRTVESFTRQMERALLGDGTLGTMSATSGTNPYTLTISDATWIEANWEEKEYINLGTSTDQFEITSVDVDNKQITVTRNDGSTAPGATDIVYLQKSKDNEPTGFMTVVDATSSTLYNITVARRWQSYQKTLSNSETISHELLNEAVLEMERKTGRIPTHMWASYTQYRKFKNQREDLKRFTLRPRDKRFKDLVSFSGVSFDADAGDIPMMPHRYVPEDRVYLMNMDKDNMRLFQAPGWGWFDEDGTVFLRMADDDAYEARYGGYGELYINPALQGKIDGLST